MEDAKEIRERTRGVEGAVGVWIGAGVGGGVLTGDESELDGSDSTDAERRRVR